ncbi:MAG: hypothetical protein KatS3mg060_3195 [Dehalococcoidia bacterium]|nr:MAG: hypothetical protein KatS3mg060_3195 [Dehalococcoidia bacterium]
MIVAPISPAEFLPTSVTSDRPASDPGEFAAALAAAGQPEPFTGAEAGSVPSEEAPKEPGEEAPAPDLSEALALLLLALPPVDGLAPSSGAVTSPAPAAPTAGPPAPPPFPPIAGPSFQPLVTPPPAAPPTAGELAALVQAVVGGDLVGPATLTIEPAAPPGALGPAAELTIATVSDNPSERAVPPAEQPLPPVAPATAAVAQESVPPAPEPQTRQLVEQLVPRLAPRLDQGGELRITLQPESLGTIDVALRVGPDGIHVHLAADDTARDLLQAGLAELRGALRSSDGRELAIEVAGRLGSGFDANTPFGRGTGWHTPTPTLRRAPTGQPAETLSPMTVMTTASGRIDYRI